jgi:NADPH:quinone reductase-like Zn-dependent oxidoreductase
MKPNRLVAATLLSIALPALSLSAPAKMQAIVQSGGTGPDSLRLQTIDTPAPGAGQVLVKVYAAGVNPVDWKRRLNPPALATGAPPVIPGFDVAGVVDALGAGVTTLKVGDAVFGRVSGAYAQYAVADADSVMKKPSSFTFEQAGGIPVAGVAGYRAADEARIKPGQRVAVIGAAGGAGSVAVIVAKDRGAKVVASGHSSQQAYLQTLGVDEFVAYDKENVAAKIGTVDAALNMVDGQAEAGLGYVKKGGYFTSIAGGPGDDKCKAASVTCVVIGPGYRGPSLGDTLRSLAELADRGKYDVKVTRTFPIAQAAAAQELNRTGDTTGKIVLSVDPQSGRR